MVYQLIKKGSSIVEPFVVMVERETRFELATSTLARLHSTTELFPLDLFLCVKTAMFIQSLKISVNKKRVKQEFFTIIIISSTVTKNREGFFCIGYNCVFGYYSKELISLI